MLQFFVTIYGRRVDSLEQFAKYCEDWNAVYVGILVQLLHMLHF